MAALAPSSPPAMCTVTLASTPSIMSCWNAHWNGELAVNWATMGKDDDSTPGRLASKKICW